MTQLNFPTTGLYDGYEYTGDNGVVYIYDGVKWVGHAPNSTPGNNSIINDGHVVQVDGDGNLVIPTGATIKYASGAPVVTGGGSATTSTLINGSYTVSIGNDGKFQSNNTTITSLDLRDASGAGFYTSGDGYTLRSNGSNNWIFKTDGNLVVPTAGIIKANPDSYTGIATHDMNTFAYVNADGFFVDTLYNTAEYEWHFNNTGGLTLPSSIFPITFSAVLLPIYGGAPDIGPYGGDAWTLSVTFTEDANGVVSTSVAQIFPISNNPGYKTGDTYHFTQTAHGIPGYTLTIVLDNVQYPGGAGWTANVECSQAPASPSTVSSNHAIKINSNNNIWAFGTDGTLTLPTGAEIVIDVPGSFVARSTSGITLFDNNANPSGMVEGDLGEVAFFADVNSAQNARISLVKMSATPGEPVVLNWTFDKNGVLTLPNGSTIGNGDAGAGVPITTSRGTILLGNVAECEGGESHFHIMKAGQQDIDLFLGDDSNYVKLPSTGGVEISSSEIGGQHYWRFGTDGYLSGQSLYLQGYFKGVDGSTGTVGQVLTKNTNGGVYWADSTGGSGGPVFQLTSGTAVVSLNTSGALTLPLGSQLLEKTWSTTVTAITTGTRTFVTFAATEFGYAEQGQITISGVDTPNDVNSTWYYQASDPNQVELHYNEDFASPVNSTSWSAYTSGGTVTLIIQLQLNSNGNIWKFMADGSTIVPNGQRVIFGEQNGGSYIQAGMGFHINSTEGISLEAVDLTDPAAPVTHGWYFSPYGALQFPDSSIQTTSAQVQFRGIAFPTGTAGDAKGTLAYSTLTNALYLATASYVQQVQTTSTHSLVTDQTILNGQDINGNLGFSFATASDPTLAQTLFDIAVGNVGGSITIESPAFDGVRNPDPQGINYGIDRSHFYIQIPFVSGDPGQINSGTTFTVTVTLDPVQPTIWNTIITDTHPGYQLTSGTAHLTVTNGSVGISPGTSIIFDRDTLGDYQGAYLGSGPYEVSDFTTTFFISLGSPMLLGGAGVQIVDYTSLLNGGYNGSAPEAAAIFVGNTDATGGVQGLQDHDRTIGSVRVQSYNTATTSTYLWTFDNTGILSIPGTISAGSTATVTAGVARTAWSNFLASQFNNSNSPFIVQDVQHDQAGNVIATLTDANTGTNQTSTITITTQTSMVVKYSPEGAVLWSQKITGPIAPATFGLAVDSGNNIYINLVDLATTTTTVVKLLGTDGSLVWATDLTDAGDVGFNALISPDGNLVVNGVYNNAGSNNMYLMKINSATGSVMWQKQLPDPGSNDIDTGLAIDPNTGNIAVSGSSQGANLGFVGIVNSNGNYVNGAEFTVNIGEGVCEVCDAIYDSQGHLYVSGAVSTTSTVTAGFLAKIDTNLTLLWARQIGQGNGCVDVATSLVVDEHDNVYVSGFTSDPNQGGLPVTSLGSFAPDGTERWQYWFETSNNNVTLPGGLGADAFQNSFTDLGNNTSYHNGMIALGVISGNESNYYPYVLQVPADGTPVSFGNIGIPDMLPIHSTTSTWAAITATVTVTTGLPLTISAGTLTVATDVSVASAGISLGYNGTFEYDYTTSTVYTHQSSWQFTPDGGLTFPNAGSPDINSEIYTTNGGNQTVFETFYTGNGRGAGQKLTLDYDAGTVKIQSVPGKEWTFDTDGSLTLPPGSTSTIQSGQIFSQVNSGFLNLDVQFNSDVHGGVRMGTAANRPVDIVTNFEISPNVWRFGTDSTLTLPTGGEILDISGLGLGLSTGFIDPNGITVGTAPGNDITFTTSDGVGLYSNGNLWQFGTDSTITLPTGGDIVRDGVSVLGGGSATTSTLYDATNTYNVYLDTSGNLNLSSTGIIQGSNADTDVYIQGGSNTWQFNASGNIVFPDMSAQGTAWLGAGSYDLSNFNNNSGFVTGTPWQNEGYLTSAFSGNYSDLSGAPTSLNAFSNDPGFITTWSLYQDSNPTLAGTLNLSGNKLQSAVTGQYAASTNHPVTLEAQYSYNATSWEMTGTGHGYSNGTNIATTGGSGTGMTVNIYVSGPGQVNSIQVNQPGTGYQNGDVIGITGGDGTAVFVIHNYNSLNNGATADWTFGIDNSLHGIMTLPQGSTIGETPSTTVLTPPGASSGWIFGADGTLTTPGSIIPNADAQYDLGSTSTRFRSAYVGTGSLFIQDISLGTNAELTVDNGLLSINGISSFKAGSLLIANNTLTTFDSTLDINMGDPGGGDTGGINVYRNIHSVFNNLYETGGQITADTSVQVGRLLISNQPGDANAPGITTTDTSVDFSLGLLNDTGNLVINRNVIRNGNHGATDTVTNYFPDVPVGVNTPYQIYGGTDNSILAVELTVILQYGTISDTDTELTKLLATMNAGGTANLVVLGQSLTTTAFAPATYTAGVAGGVLTVSVQTAADSSTAFYRYHATEFGGYFGA